MIFFFKMSLPHDRSGSTCDSQPFTWATWVTASVLSYIEYIRSKLLIVFCSRMQLGSLISDHPVLIILVSGAPRRGHTRLTHWAWGPFAATAQVSLWSPVLTASVSAVPPARFATVQARPRPVQFSPKPSPAATAADWRRFWRDWTGRDALGRSQTGPEQRSRQVRWGPAFRSAPSRVGRGWRFTPVPRVSLPQAAGALPGQVFVFTPPGTFWWWCMQIWHPEAFPSAEHDLCRGAELHQRSLHCAEARGYQSSL